MKSLYPLIISIFNKQILNGREESVKTKTVIPEGLMERLAGDGFKSELQAMLYNQQLILDAEQYCREKILLSFQILLPRKIFKKSESKIRQAKADMETANLVKQRIYQFIQDNQGAVKPEINQTISKRIESDKRFYFRMKRILE